MHSTSGACSGGREHHRLGLHCGVDHHAGEIGRRHRAGPGRHSQAPLQQGQKLFLAHALAPARQRAAVEHQPVPEELLAAEVLEVRVLHPAIAQRLVGQIVRVLQHGEPGHQPRRQRWVSAPNISLWTARSPKALGMSRIASDSPAGCAMTASLDPG
jgi:hypothetical protein